MQCTLEILLYFCNSNASIFHLRCKISRRIQPFGQNFWKTRGKFGKSEKHTFFLKIHISKTYPQNPSKLLPSTLQTKYFQMKKNLKWHRTIKNHFSLKFRFFLIFRPYLRLNRHFPHSPLLFQKFCSDGWILREIFHRKWLSRYTFCTTLTVLCVWKRKETDFSENRLFFGFFRFFSVFFRTTKKWENSVFQSNKSTQKHIQIVIFDVKFLVESNQSNRIFGKLEENLENWENPLFFEKFISQKHILKIL